MQIPGTTWTAEGIGGGGSQTFNIKTDGTLWAWGYNGAGQLGQNNRTNYSSPRQVGGDTNWSTVVGSSGFVLLTKTDGTAWWMGQQEKGQSGDNSAHDTVRSSPVQIPGDWSNNKGFASANTGNSGAIKSDGTLWMWGNNQYGQLGVNNRTQRSSPVQVPGTSWKELQINWDEVVGATRTDGTLWVWGRAYQGQLGLNAPASEHYSSPVQIPGTWSFATTYLNGSMGVKTDGTLWAWGANVYGELANNFVGNRSSPIQIPGTGWDTTGKWKQVYGGAQTVGVIKNL